MAQSKRTFNQARIERDLDDRIVPQGTYRDALNISIDTSEDANVGVIENLKGNELIANQDILGLSSSSNPNAKVIGSYPHPEKDRIYYFVTGDKSDGIFEHSLKDNTINTIIIDNSTFVASSPTKVILPKFAFSDAAVSASVNNAGIISVTSPIAVVVALTADFNTTVSSNTVRSITVQVTVPSGYSNTGKFLTGTVTATQNAIAAPDVSILDCTNITGTSVTLNGQYTANNGLTAIGFYYKANTGGSATVTTHSNEHVIRTLSGRAANLSNSFDNVLDNDILVKDKDGTTIAASNYIYINNSGNVSTIAFKSSLGTDAQIRAKLPITVSQVSTATTVSNSLTAAQIQSSGTNAAVTPITSPFSKDITGLTAGTSYVAVAYATNSVGTTLSSIKYFTTVASSISRPIANKLYITPVIAFSNDGLGNVGVPPNTFQTANDTRQVGYGPLIKSDNNLYFTVFNTTADGSHSSQTVLGGSSASNSSITVSNSGPATLTFLDISFPSTKHAAFKVDLSGKAAGLYTITVSKSGFTSNSTQIKVGSPSNATFTSKFTPSFAKTGTGTVPILAEGHSSSFEYNVPGDAQRIAATTDPFIIGPLESGNKGSIIIPFANSASIGSGNTGFTSFTSFDASKLDVSISGKTAGVDYDFFIFDTAPAIYGTNPGILIECDPNTLNAGTSTVTHTVNITYNY